MEPFGFLSAGELIVGRGSVAKLAERVSAKRVFIVTDAVLVAAGLLRPVLESLSRAGVQVQVFEGCVPEPPSDVVYAATEAARAFGPEAVLGFGGGSNMDTAKLVALLLSHGGSLDDYVGDSRVPGPVLPLICLPTTAGTGSEVSAAAVYTDVARKIKVSCLSQYLRPKLAIVDGAFTDRCPAKVSADSGIDALTHAIEAYTACPQAEFQARPGGATVYQGKNPLADLCAAEAIRLVAKHLRDAVYTPTNTIARDGMALAGTLGGLAFSNAGVALVHAMEYPVGGAVHVSHGAGNGLLLPYVMRFNAPACESSLAEIGELLAGTRTAKAAIQAVEKLREDVGIPTRLRDLGVTREMLPGFADKAFAIKRLMRVNPRMPQSTGEILAIYESAF
ncbi:MAG: iron-containing alcohol dehydrogenase [Fimbriiglobus sp.]